MTDLKHFVQTNLLNKAGNLNSKKCTRSWFVNSGHADRLRQIENHIQFVQPLTTKLFCILNNIVSYPLCSCGDRVKLVQNRTLTKYCSLSCANKDPERISKIIANTDYAAKQLKTKATNLVRYGHESVTQSNHFKDKTKQTLLKNYGVSNISQVESIKIKKSATLHHNYPNGVVKAKSSLAISDDVIASVIKDFTISKLAPLVISQKYNIAFSTTYKIIHQHGLADMIRKRSCYETEIAHFLSQYGIDYRQNCRKTIAPLELDFVIENSDIAIEFHGLYWHSELAGVDKEYHRNKYQVCKDRGIQLLQIFENEWLDNSDLVKSIIHNAIGNTTNTVYARKCQIRELTSTEAREFINSNHIQRYVNSSIRLGLIDNDQLVAVMTFGKSRFNNKYQYELVRFCNLLGTSVIGGASKILSHFEQQYNPNSIVSYCDLRYFTGKLYTNLGFKYLYDSAPNYHYFNKRSTKLQSRHKFQKHKLSEILPKFDHNLSESDNMFANGFNRIWDCGQGVFAKTYQET